jgi:hypothetical protein
MEALDQLVAVVALSMGMAWASGINLYAAVLTLAVLANTGNITLPEQLQIVADPLVMTAAGVMYAVEFFADKIPGVDTGWDALQSFVRIPAGAILAATAIGDVTPAAQLAAAILGGGLTAATHATKAGSRVLINTSPEPVSNWSASIGEDIAVISGVWAALSHPFVFLGLLLLFILLMAWSLPKLWRGVRLVVSRLATLFGRTQKPVAIAKATERHKKEQKGDGGIK